MLSDYFNFIYRSFKRTKHLDEAILTETRLKRCLSLFELTTLGIGSTIGLGMYVIGGQVASTKAGPGVVASYFIAAVVSSFAALCYAEFGARVPKAGSAYIYSYVTVGELMAFFIGWDLVLEYVIGAASIARGYSGYIDSLVGRQIEKFFRYWMPLYITGISEYPDFLAFSIVLGLSLMLAFGVKASTRFHAIFTILNLVVVMFILIAGGMKADAHNWALGPKEVPHEGAGYGGFLPFGFGGLMAGAATCFYAFIGFDVIATSAEEVKNPQRNIPIAIVLSLAIVTVVYMSVAAVQTLAWPYWDQNNGAPIPYIFERLDMPFAKWIIAIGALAGLSSALMGALFPLPRILYAMAGDGLLFRFLASVSPTFQTPLKATIVSGLFAAVMSALFNVNELADMMSIGTLNAYTLVSFSVLVLRYDCVHPNDCDQDMDDDRYPSPGFGESPSSIFSDIILPDQGQATFPMTSRPRSESIKSKRCESFPREMLGFIFNIGNQSTPTVFTSNLSKWLISITTALVILLDIFLITLQDYLYIVSPWAIAIVAINCTALGVGMIAISRQPKSTVDLSFRVPWVPLIPIISIFCNCYLALNLSSYTWWRFLIWFVAGMVIYFTYGMWHSSERKKERQKKASQDIMTLTVPRLNASYKRCTTPTQLTLLSPPTPVGINRRNRDRAVI